MSVNDSKPDPIDHGKVRAFYDQEYYADVDGGGCVDWHPRRIAARLGNLDGRAVLDIACGTGEWLAHLQSLGAAPSGIDISSVAVGACRDRLPRTEVHEGVAEALPFEAGRFDLVTCLGSLEHFLDQSKALAEMRRVAKSDARFLILVPNAGFLTRRLGLYGGTDQTAVRETVRPLAEWESLLTAAGLRIRARWRDLHPLSLRWIRLGPTLAWPLRAAQALSLAVWPIAWQYQVYFYCEHAGGGSGPV